MTTRRTVLSAIAGIPLAVKAALSKPVQTEPMRGGGMWLHFEECGISKFHRYETFSRLSTYIRTQTHSKWLGHYTRTHWETMREGEYFRNARRAAIEGDSLAVTFIEVPVQRAKIETIDLGRLADVPLSYFYTADVVTYQKYDGTIQFRKCRWMYPEDASVEFARRSPYNNVSESGHVIFADEKPGKERIKIYG